MALFTGRVFFIRPDDDGSGKATLLPRFMVLTDHTIITYRRDPTVYPDEKPLQTSPVGASFAVEDCGNETYDGRVLFVFRVYSKAQPDQGGKIASANATSAQEWISSIRMAIDRKLGKDALLSSDEEFISAYVAHQQGNARAAAAATSAAAGGVSVVPVGRTFARTATYQAERRAFPQSTSLSHSLSRRGGDLADVEVRAPSPLGTRPVASSTSPSSASARSPAFATRGNSEASFTPSSLGPGKLPVRRELQRVTSASQVMTDSPSGESGSDSDWLSPSESHGATYSSGPERGSEGGRGGGQMSARGMQRVRSNPASRSDDSDWLAPSDNPTGSYGQAEGGREVSQLQKGGQQRGGRQVPRSEEIDGLPLGDSPSGSHQSEKTPPSQKLPVKASTARGIHQRGRWGGSYGGSMIERSSAGLKGDREREGLFEHGGEFTQSAFSDDLSAPLLRVASSGRGRVGSGSFRGDAALPPAVPKMLRSASVSAAAAAAAAGGGGGAGAAAAAAAPTGELLFQQVSAKLAAYQQQPGAAATAPTVTAIATPSAAGANSVRMPAGVPLTGVTGGGAAANPVANVPEVRRLRKAHSSLSERERSPSGSTTAAAASPFKAGNPGLIAGRGPVTSLNPPAAAAAPERITAMQLLPNRPAAAVAAAAAGGGVRPSGGVFPTAGAQFAAGRNVWSNPNPNPNPGVGPARLAGGSTAGAMQQPAGHRRRMSSIELGTAVITSLESGGGGAGLGATAAIGGAAAAGAGAGGGTVHDVQVLVLSPGGEAQLLSSPGIRLEGQQKRMMRTTSLGIGSGGSGGGAAGGSFSSYSSRGGEGDGESSESESEGEVLQLFKAMERRRRSPQDPAMASSSSASASPSAGDGAHSAGKIGGGGSRSAVTRSNSVAFGALQVSGGAGAVLRSTSARTHRRTPTYDVSSIHAPVAPVPRHNGPVSGPSGISSSSRAKIPSPPVEPRAGGGQAVAAPHSMPRKAGSRIHQRSASFHERPAIRGFSTEAQ